MHSINVNNLLIACCFIGLLLGTTLSAADALTAEPGALDVANIRTLTQTDPNLTGTGTLIGTICRSQSYVNSRPQNDFHFNMNHASMFDADVRFMDGSDGRFSVSEHATSIGGILLGLDEHASHPDIGSFQYRGVCPDASVNAYEFEQFSIQNVLAGKPVTEKILVLSLGIMFEDWWVRGLEQIAAENDILVVASVGNGTRDYTPQPLFPAAGSNVLSVGVVDAVTDADGTIHLRDFSTPKRIHSSSGPTEDRRCKPDMVAPGTALVPVANNENGYELKHNWSSLAAPIVAGTAALLEQKILSDEDLERAFDRPGQNLVLKAVLMNSARKLPYWHKGQPGPEDDHEAPLDYKQGTGMIDAMAAYQQLLAGMNNPGQVKSAGWDNRVLDGSNSVYEYTFQASDPNQMITATLCWNRAYESEYPFNHQLDQDGDLRLELWGTPLDSPNEQILLDFSDSVNDNVEHLYLAGSNTYSTYTLRVLFNEQQDTETPKQRFALAWSVAPDRQVGNIWWQDLNADDMIDQHDQIIYSVLSNENKDILRVLFETDLFKLQPEQIDLLITQWPQFAPYVSDVTPDLIRSPDSP